MSTKVVTEETQESKFVAELMARARAAQKVIEKYTQEQFVRDVQKIFGVKVTGKANQETLESTITISKFISHKHPVVIPIQKYLEELRYYDGDIDGSYGSKTTKAVENLQKDIGANADGEITRMNKTWRFLLGMK